MEGHIERNPAEPTRTPTPKVKRERLLLEHFVVIRRRLSLIRNGCPMRAILPWSLGSAAKIFRFSGLVI